MSLKLRVYYVPREDTTPFPRIYDVELEYNVLGDSVPLERLRFAKEIVPCE